MPIEREQGSEEPRGRVFENTRKLFDAIQAKGKNGLPKLRIYGKRLGQFSSKTSPKEYYWDLTDVPDSFVDAHIYKADEFRIYLNFYGKVENVVRQAPKPLAHLVINGANIGEYHVEVIE